MERHRIFLPISEIQVTCYSGMGCLVVIAMQHALVSTSGCCAAWLRSSSRAGVELTGLLCSMGMGCVCQLGVMRVHVVLQIAREACGNRSMARGCIPVADQHS